MITPQSPPTSPPQTTGPCWPGFCCPSLHGTSEELSGQAEGCTSVVQDICPALRGLSSPARGLGFTTVPANQETQSQLSPVSSEANSSLLSHPQEARGKRPQKCGQGRIGFPMTLNLLRERGLCRWHLSGGPASLAPLDHLQNVGMNKAHLVQSQPGRRARVRTACLGEVRGQEAMTAVRRQDPHAPPARRLPPLSLPTAPHIPQEGR